MVRRLGFLASHGGTSARAITVACAEGRLPFEPAVVVSNNPDAEVVQWAHDAGLACRHLSGRTHPDPDELDQAICATLVEMQVDLVVLSGYMKMLGPRTVQTFQDRILNIHPAPLPEFGGKGMYGIHVHRAVLDASIEQSAVSVHVVDEKYDHGPVVATLPVVIGSASSPEGLQAKVAALEPRAYISVLERIATGELKLEHLPTTPLVLESS
jgi:phosphoribosylglycinamide formyltransferase 1